MIKRIFYSLHRVLGTILSILFLIWFLSGFVMIYHTFPKVNVKDKYRAMEVLSDSLPSIHAIIDSLPHSSVYSIQLQSQLNQPVLEITAKDTVYTLPQTSRSFDYIQEYAQRWSTSDIIRVDTLYELEQWIPFDRLRKELPIYKFYFGDVDEHQLYVSSRTGEGLQFTNKINRMWAWLGAIPHWIYFTSLRQNTSLWISTIVWLSGIGSIMCFIGIIMGIQMYYKRYRKKGKFESPYRKFAYKWHHILGFIFGLFVFTFVFSGMMSLNKTPYWLVKLHNPSVGKNANRNSMIDQNKYTLHYSQLLEQYPNQVKSIEWATFGDLPLYKVVIGDSLYLFNASCSEVTPLLLDEDIIKDKFVSLHKEAMNISLMTQYDNYYISRKNKLSLPVYKVEVSDVDKHTYYVNPTNGVIHFYNDNKRFRRWAYQGLHSFNIKFLVDRPILWNIVMWTAMIGGTLVSLTGVWLSVRFIKRKLKRKKKIICQKEE